MLSMQDMYKIFYISLYRNMYFNFLGSVCEVFINGANSIVTKQLLFQEGCMKYSAYYL